MNKKQLTWGTTRSSLLTDNDKIEIGVELNCRASLFPKGFEFTLTEGKEQDCKNYIKTTFDVVIAHIDENNICIYQNEQDRKNDKRW